VSTRRVHGGAAQRRGLDGDVNLREDYLRAVSHVGVGRNQAVALVEASSGQPFAACRAVHLLPILGELLELAQRTTHANGGPACRV
jgi:hypothetical protein